MTSIKNFNGAALFVSMMCVSPSAQSSSLVDTLQELSTKAKVLAVNRWQGLSTEAKVFIAVPTVIGGLIVTKALYESLPWVKERREYERRLAEKCQQEELVKKQQKRERQLLADLKNQICSLEKEYFDLSTRMADLLNVSSDASLFAAHVNGQYSSATEPLVSAFNELKHASKKIHDDVQRIMATVHGDHSTSHFPDEWRLLSTQFEQARVQVQVEEIDVAVATVLAHIKQLPEFASQLAAVEKRAFLAETKALLKKQVAAYVKAQTAYDILVQQQARAEQQRLEAEVARLSGALNAHYYDLFGASSNTYIIDVQQELNLLVYQAQLDRDRAVQVEQLRLAEETRRQAERARYQANRARQQAEEARLQADRAQREREAQRRETADARRQEEARRRNDQERQAREAEKAQKAQAEKVRQEVEKAKLAAQAAEAAKKKAAEEAQKKANKAKPAAQTQRNQEAQEQYAIYHDFWN